MQSLLLKLEEEVAARKHPQRDHSNVLRLVGIGAMICFVSFQFGTRMGHSEPTLPGSSARASVVALEKKVDELQGQLDLKTMYAERLEQIVRNSAHYGITADLAAAIEDIARAEDIDPRIAFELVRVESEFNPRAISPVGALGLTQLMPATANMLSPGITRDQIFDRETNLRLGFRFLRSMLHYYDGNVRLALYAYNRGPGTVDRLLAEGQDPSNGYARMVLGN
jgi:soluble lytic murein transglycosylase-like protein